MEVPKITEQVPQTVIEHKIDQNKLASIGTDFALLALCILVAFVSFWDVGFTLNKAFAVGWLSVFIFFVSSTTYRSKYDGGIYKGRQTDEYKKAIAAFEKARDYIISKSIADELAEWCNEYRVKDIERLRKSIVCPYMSYKEYTENYLNISKEKVNRCNLSRQAKKAVNTANAIVPVELSADKLLGVSVNVNLFGKRRILPISGQEKRKHDMIINYATKFLFTFVLGMFSIQILSDPTLETFLQWLVRMFPVIMAYITGEKSGERNISTIEIRRISAQSQMLQLFFAERKMDFAEEGQDNEVIPRIRSNG